MEVKMLVAFMLVGLCRGFIVFPSLPLSLSTSAALRLAPSSCSCWRSSCARTDAQAGRWRRTKLSGTSSRGNVRMFGEVSPQVANKLVQEEEWAYIDVRADYEFEHGRPAGAINIPAFFSTASGMMVNPDFVDQVAEKFPDKNAKLVMGCQMGSRSAQATAWLENAGYSEAVNMEGGFSAWARDDSLPVEV